MTMMPVFARDVLASRRERATARWSRAVGVGAAGAALFMAGFGGRTRRRAPGARLLGCCSAWCSPAARAGAEFLVGARAVHPRRLPDGAERHRRQHACSSSRPPTELRGRVMGFYSFVVLGMAPFGSLQAGWMAEHFGVRAAVGRGGLVCLWRRLVVGAGREEAGHGGRKRRGRAAESREQAEPVPGSPSAARDPLPGRSDARRSRLRSLRSATDRAVAPFPLPFPSPPPSPHADHHLPPVRRRRLASGPAGGRGAGLAGGGQRAGRAGGGPGRAPAGGRGRAGGAGPDLRRAAGPDPRRRRRPRCSRRRDGRRR